MCNCGKKRTEYSKQNSSIIATPASPASISSAINIKFEYTGNTALTVIGNITGRQYRFNSPGDMQTVNFHDASFMMALPVLKKVQ
ncbi:MAG: hypothetical protein ACR2FN_05920 [Chitinophagaceae bacterium]